MKLDMQSYLKHNCYVEPQILIEEKRRPRHSLQKVKLEGMHKLIIDGNCDWGYELLVCICSRGPVIKVYFIMGQSFMNKVIVILL
jgi:hypothetical protein